MTPDDHRHGTTAGHRLHIAEGEEACEPCRAAKTRYEKRRKMYGDRLIPAIGYRRRIRALMALGHSGAEIAGRMGVTYQAVHKLEHGTSPKMQRATAAKVAAVYDELSMIIPTGYHRTRIRNKARRLGYAPPLAFNNIDDPNERPTDWQYRSADRSDVLADLDEMQAGITEACARLKVSREALEKWCERHDQMPLFRRLRDREDNLREWNNQHTVEGAA